MLRVPAEVKGQGPAAVAAHLIAQNASLTCSDPQEVAEEAVCMHMEAMNVFDMLAEMVFLDGNGLSGLFELWKSNCACRMSGSALEGSQIA